MTARKASDLTNYFSAAKQSQQLSEAEEELQQLRAEIEELRSEGAAELEEQLATLRSQLQSQSGILSISIEQIEPNPEQPRQTFLPELSLPSTPQNLPNISLTSPTALGIW